MSDSLEIQLKNEIDDIKGRIDAIMKKIEDLAPEPEEEKSPEENLAEDLTKETNGEGQGPS
jgi:peptidoglycan hydrolase CwlO-like protein